MGKTDSRANAVRVAIVGNGGMEERIIRALRADGIVAGVCAFDVDRPADRSDNPAPDVVVIDEPGGSLRAQVEILLEQLPSTPLIVVAGDSNAAEIRWGLTRGVAGVVLEDDVETCLALAVHLVVLGQLVLPGSFRSAVSTPALSPREKQVLAMMVMGFGNREIAQKLHVTEGTVKSHLSSAYRKLGVASRSEASRAILDPDRGLGTGILAILDSADEPV